MMNEDDAGVRAAAIEALGCMGAVGAAFLEDIGERLYLGAPNEQSVARIAMGKLGFVPVAAPAPLPPAEEPKLYYESVLAAERAKMGLKGGYKSGGATAAGPSGQAAKSSNATNGKAMRM